MSQLPKDAMLKDFTFHAIKVGRLMKLKLSITLCENSVKDFVGIFKLFHKMFTLKHIYQESPSVENYSLLNFNRRSTSFILSTTLSASLPVIVIILYDVLGNS